MAEKTTQDMELSKLNDYVTEYLDATTDARELSEKCRRYYDGTQWTTCELKELRDRKQPAITNNRIKPKIQFLKGMENRNRTDPKAFPREPRDEESAELSTEALRYVSERNISEQKFSNGFESYLVESVEAHEIIGEFERDRVEIKHNQLTWDRLFWDPHSRQKDFLDARYLGTLQWMDFDEVLEKFPNTSEEAFNFDVAEEETFSDRPEFFVDKERKRVRVFYCYYIKMGVWTYAIFTKGAFIEEPKPSPYLDENGEPEPQFVFQAAFIDRDNNRYSEVASYLDMQDEINKRRSKALHLMSVRQTWANKGAVSEPSAIKKELAKADGHAEFNIGKWGQDFGIVPTNDMAQAQFNLLAEAKNEIDSIGANAALSGTEPRSLSGRALQSLQQGGVVELGSLFDGHKYCKNRVYRMMWNRVKQYWTEERWIRVTGDDNKAKFTSVNRPVTLEEQVRKEFGQIPPQLEGDPRLQQVVGVENQIQGLDVDIVLDEAPDTVTLQQEQFDVLARLYEANPNAIPFDLIIQASQLRNKQELMDMIKGGTEEQQAALAQARQQEQQEAREILKAEKISEIRETNANADNKEADTVKKEAETQQIMVETAIEMADAEVTPV